MHGGFVGYGMLDAACPGEIFTSPTPDQMYEAGKAVEAGAGILNLVKNYTGDVMNFEMAADMLMADGIKVQNLIIDDDVAVKDSLYTAGRRGVGTTVLMEKNCRCRCRRRLYPGAALRPGPESKPVWQKHGNGADLLHHTGQRLPPALKSAMTKWKSVSAFTVSPAFSVKKMKTVDEITEMMTLGILEDPAYHRQLRAWSPEKRRMD